MNLRQNNMTDMGFTKERYPAGTHMCLLYSHENERRSVIGKFLESGIVGNEKVSYFADSMKPEEVRKVRHTCGTAPVRFFWLMMK